MLQIEEPASCKIVFVPSFLQNDIPERFPPPGSESRNWTSWSNRKPRLNSNRVALLKSIAAQPKTSYKSLRTPESVWFLNWAIAMVAKRWPWKRQTVLAHLRSFHLAYLLSFYLAILMVNACKRYELLTFCLKGLRLRSGRKRFEPTTACSGRCRRKREGPAMEDAWTGQQWLASGNGQEIHRHKKNTSTHNEVWQVTLSPWREQEVWPADISIWTEGAHGLVLPCAPVVWSCRDSELRDSLVGGGGSGIHKRRCE